MRDTTEAEPLQVTCVHQGYELYGSDRAFAAGVGAVRAAFPAAEIDVVLPRPGGVADLVAGAATRTSFEPIWVLRRRHLSRLLTVEAARLPTAVLRAARRCRRSDLVYVNTTVVADYLLAARLFPGRVLLHIHEIPEGAALRVLRGLVRWSGAEVVFNSRATRDAFALPPSVRSHVVYNGVPGPARPEPPAYDGSRPLRVLLMGRVSRIKGQEVLVDALRAIPGCGARVEARMVGSAFEDPAAELALRDRVAAAGLGGVVTLMPFTRDPEAQLRWADVVVVPSRRPESLGMVAIEAMAHARPPIVSGIGGLREVVEDGTTGWVVPPDDPGAVAAALRSILAEPEELRRRAGPARLRYEAMFEPRAAEGALGAVLDGMLDARRAAERRPGGADRPGFAG